MKQKTKDEKVIHIKFGYDSALESKKDILASEIDLLKMSQRLVKYKELRMLELEVKGKLKGKLNSIKLDIVKLQKLLPKVKIPKILQPETHARKQRKTIKEIHKKESEEGSVESELEKIQMKLKALQR